jgi:hypothetical protein
MSSVRESSPVLGRSSEPPSAPDADGWLRTSCSTEGCPEEAEFEVVETIFGVNLPGRPVCALCAHEMGLEDADV